MEQVSLTSRLGARYIRRAAAGQVDHALGRVYVLNGAGVGRVELQIIAIDPTAGTVRVRVVTPKVGPARQDLTWSAFAESVAAGVLEDA